MNDAVFKLILGFFPIHARLVLTASAYFQNILKSSPDLYFELNRQFQTKAIIEENKSIDAVFLNEGLLEN